jgi:hypothetical protein
MIILAAVALLGGPGAAAEPDGKDKAAQEAGKATPSATKASSAQEAPSAPDPAAPAASPPTAAGSAVLPKVADASTKAKSEATDYDPQVLGALEQFCTKWMGFLAVRERENRTKMKWETAPVGVRGTFIGYSPDYECKLKQPTGPKATPVATIKYLEFLYQQEGPTNSEAAITTPRVVEATEVLEIFRYAGGKWVY